MGSYLVLYDNNWADEFNVEGFTIYNEEDYIKFKDRMVEAEKYIKEGNTIEHYFGTNQGIEFGRGYSAELKDCYKVREITDEQAVMIKELFNVRYDYGIFFPIEW